MENKKEMGFLEKFEAAGNELEKEIKDSHNGVMIMIASEVIEKKYLTANIKGNENNLAILLADVATKNKYFKIILERALMYAELK